MELDFNNIELPSNEELLKETRSEHNKKRNRDRVGMMSRQERQKLFGHTKEEKARQNKKRLANPEFHKNMRKSWELKEKNGYADKQRRIMKEAKQAQRGAFVTPFGEFDYKCEFDDYIKQNYPHCNLNGDWGLKFAPHLYYYKNKGQAKPTYETVFYTPYGKALHNSRMYKWMDRESIMQNARDANDPDATNKYWNDWWNKMTKKDPDNYYSKKEIKREWLLE